MNSGDISTTLSDYKILDASLVVNSNVSEQPLFVLDYSDYDLHPGLLPKRRRIDYF